MSRALGVFNFIQCLQKAARFFVFLVLTGATCMVSASDSKNTAKVSAVSSFSNETGSSSEESSGEDANGIIPVDTEFEALSNPYRAISGAYVGAGLDVSRIQNKVRLFLGDKDGNVDKSPKIAEKQNVTQFDVSVIGGFGSVFYENWYVGLEFKFFKRLPEKKRNFEEISIISKGCLGLNMDVRLGYQFPQNGVMVYASVGFARILGGMWAFDKTQNNKLLAKKTFGSFFPTAGVGVEYRLTQIWNIRADLRYSMGSREKKRFLYDDGSKKEVADMPVRVLEGKPTRWSVGVSAVRML